MADSSSSVLSATHQHRLHLRTVGAPGYVAHTAGKGAVVAEIKVAALEHAHDRIRVNAICPGPVRTPISEQQSDDAIYVTHSGAAPNPKKSHPPSLPRL